MIWVLWTLATGHAACPATVADLRDDAGRSEVAFAAAAGSDFAAAVSDLRADLGCLTDALGPADVAVVHRIEALSAFLAGDHDAVVASFAAARRIEPGWQLPTSLALDDHPLRRDFDRAGSVAVPARAPVPTMAVGWLRVDGVQAGDVPVAVPFVLQQFDAAGAVAWSGLVPVGGALPTWAPAPMPRSPSPSPVPVPLPPVAEHPHAGRVPLLVGAGLAAVASGLSGWQASRETARFWDPATPSAEIDRHADRANRWILVSVAAGGVAVGGVGTAVLVGRW